MRRILAGLVGLLGLIVPIAAVGGGVASASTEQYSYWWQTPYDGLNNLQIGMIYSGALLQYQIGDVGRSAIGDDWTVQMWSPAYHQVWGPFYLAPGTGAGFAPRINLYLAAPGYWVTVQFCEYAVGCHSMTLTLFNKINYN